MGYRVLLGKAEGRGYLKNMGVSGRILIKRILKKQNVSV
jgi:hypothetical protein